MSFSVAPRAWPVPDDRVGSRGAIPTVGPTDAEPAPASDPGALRRLSLRFVNRELERRYQQVVGIEGRAGFRMTTGSAAVLWLVAAAVIPAGTPIPLSLAVP